MNTTHIRWMAQSFLIMLLWGSLGCKHQTSDSESKIVGGRDVGQDATGPERWSTVGLNGCSGAIIGSDLIITAAHCYDLAMQGGFVVFGTDMFDRNQRIVMAIESGLKNTSYQSSGNDIALLKLSGTIPEGYRPMALHKPDMPVYKEDQVRLAGYGSDNTENSFGTLRYVTSYLGKRTEDGSLYVRNGTTAACTGDSGGPMMLLRNGEWYLVGVASLANMDRSTGTCSGGNYYAPIRENYSLIVNLAQTLTGRAEPFSPIASADPAMQADELVQEELSIVATSQVTSIGERLVVAIQNNSSQLASDCTLTMTVVRDDGTLVTTYDLSTTVESLAAGEIQEVSFPDYLAGLAAVLGEMRDFSLNHQCRGLSSVEP